MSVWLKKCFVFDNCSSNIAAMTENKNKQTVDPVKQWTETEGLAFSLRIVCSNSLWSGIAVATLLSMGFDEQLVYDAVEMAGPSEESASAWCADGTSKDLTSGTKMQGSARQGQVRAVPFRAGCAQSHGLFSRANHS